jgi:glycerophosphoryl diester phosphodiesterase
MTGQGLRILHQGRITRLKWHRLRRAKSEGVFSAKVMAEGLRIGASLELDLRRRADGGFVVLHDSTLDRETTGHGPLEGGVTGLTYRSSGDRVILSEDLAMMLPTAHPEALLHFDMKDDLATIDQAGMDHLAQYFGAAKTPIIFSGGCPNLIIALAQQLPQITRGIDPTDRLVELWHQQRMDLLSSLLVSELVSDARPDTCYLNWELVLAVKAHGLDLVALCHDYGVKVDCWTFNLAHPEKGFSDQEWTNFQALIALGPDQITTDEALAIEAAWITRNG